MQRDDSLTENSVRLLGALARTPFAEQHELAAFAGIPPSSTLESLLALEAKGLAAFVRHTRTNTSRVRRWHLSPRGIIPLAELWDTTTEELLRELPLSAEWRCHLLRRLDAVAPLYRTGREVAECTGSPVEWRWMRSGALDAILELSDDGTLALLRLGPTLSWQAMRSRIGTLYGMQRAGRCPTALLLLPGNIETQRLAADLRRRAIDAYAASEHDVMNTAPGSAVWRSLREVRGLTLSQVIEMTRDMRDVRVRAEGYSRRETMPTDTLSLGTDGLDLVSTELTMPDRRLLDAIYDWPLTSAAHLGMALGMTEGMMKKTRAQLVRRCLVCQVRIGSTPELRWRNGTRLCLSADGLRYIARRDRRRVSDLLGRWIIASDEGGDGRLEVPHYRLDGSKLRVLARELRHTDGVSGFVAGLAAACRHDEDWRLHQALPPHRWERWFRYDTGWRSVRPDATVEIAHRGSRLSFLLEYEMRAIKPATMAAKFLRYRRYFGAADTRADFDGRRAATLFVFADEATASRFCALAAEAPRHPLPLLVSNSEVLTETGPLERVWRSPWQLERGLVSLAAAF
ncbi:MAG: replication-relaxation family protein [Chloroflexota bacterium]|nr:replication-relaxation family protein [Chloroflexota bacterium]